MILKVSDCKRLQGDCKSYSPLEEKFINSRIHIYDEEVITSKVLVIISHEHIRRRVEIIKRATFSFSLYSEYITHYSGLYSVLQ